tara:strand:+ start:12167 stop:12313 length:147 start_codon:yes stop_codon:yes gene_type:complete
MEKQAFILFGHDPTPALSAVEMGQAITTRYPDYHRDELKQTVLSFVQL